MAGKPVSGARIVARAKRDPAFLARALANPGLRSMLPSGMLSPAQQQARVLNAPVLPGSSLTNRDVQGQVNAAADLQFGPNAVGRLNQQNQDVQGWYQAYQADLARHAQNVGQINQQAAQQARGLQQGVVQAPSDATGQQAASVRQQMIAALASGQAGRGVANQTYADTLANVVAPGQRLQAGLGGQSAVRDLQGKIGAFKAVQTGQLVNAEAKNLIDQQKNEIAAKALNLNQTTKLNPATGLPYDINPKTGRPYPKPKTAADKKTAADLAFFKKHGYYPGTGKPKAPAKPKVKSPYLPQTSQNTAKDAVDSAVTAAKSLKASYSQSEVRSLLLNGRAAQTIKDPKTGQSVKIPAVPKHGKRWVNVAMDIAYNGYISPANIKALHAAGLKVDALGYPIKKPAVKAPAPATSPSWFGDVQNVSSSLGS